MNKIKFLSTKTHFGFTLAEVLITLGIIGVVAAITIPTLNQRNFEKQTVTVDGKVVDIGVRLAATLAVLALYVVLSVAVWSFVKEKMRRTRA